MNDRDEKRADLTVRWTQAQPNVAAFIRSIIRNPSDVDDVLQDAAYRIAMKFDDYDPARPFVAWAIGIARNCVLEWHRAHSRDRHMFDVETVERVADAYAQRAPEHDAARIALEHCLEKLPAKSRRMLDMRYTQELKPARIAELLDTTPQTVSTTLYRVRETLRECIENARQDSEAAP